MATIDPGAHFRTCPLTAAACEAGRAQLAEREAEAYKRSDAVEIDAEVTA